MNTKIKELKPLVAKCNKRNRDIEKRRNSERAVITYTREPLLKEDKE